MMRMRAGHDELSTSSIEDDEDGDEDRDEGMEVQGLGLVNFFGISQPFLSPSLRLKRSLTRLIIMACDWFDDHSLHILRKL